jgi:prepilin-type N-terminal cleavage/methylation domain-containing protein
MKYLRPTRSAGFTIVELVVVVAVIGILVAISALSYRGAGVRAENVKTISAMDQYAEVLQTYAVKNGTYPIEPNWPCFGPYPQTTCAAVNGGSAATCYGFGSTASESGFDAKLKAIVDGDLPQPSIQTMNCGGKHHSGAWYHSADGVSVEVVYLLRGNQQCTVSGFNLVWRGQLNDTTVCNVTPPPLS